MEQYLGNLLTDNNWIFLFAGIVLAIIIWKVIKYPVTDYKRNKRFYDYVEENGYDPVINEGDDPSEPEYEIHIFDKSRKPGNDKMVIPYIANHPYFINNWGVIFAILTDKDHNKILLVDKNGEGITSYPIVCEGSEDGISVKDVRYKRRSTDLVFYLLPPGRDFSITL